MTCKFLLHTRRRSWNFYGQLGKLLDSLRRKKPQKRFVLLHFNWVTECRASSRKWFPRSHTHCVCTGGVSLFNWNRNKDARVCVWSWKSFGFQVLTNGSKSNQRKWLNFSEGGRVLPETLAAPENKKILYSPWFSFFPYSFFSLLLFSN